ncbi:outer membrane lipoprotein chaperone LolA [Nitratidesulfovibrio vulgaris]|uniref:outer membrane lipoprotein chaperone LolA n=1 Tax=Nitratidesulfovibrio vulgaris TaxID=881 RepID=UPI0013DEFC2E|nr:outer membrane lipoprotein chaperone LolA [Nitratidesulfovibrio vulgaris]
MNRKTLRAIALSALLLLGGTASALAGTAAQDIQKRYDTVTTLKAAFTQKLLHRESGSTETRNGTLLFRKPLLIRWETGGKNPEVLVISSQDIWNFLPDEELAYRYPLDLVQDSKSIIKVITGQAKLDQDFNVVEEGQEEGLTRLHLYPKEPVQQLTEAILWVDPQEHLIRRVRVYDFYGNENEIDFTSLEANATVADKAFTFTPPKGTEVQDRLKEGAPEKQLFN